MSSKYDDLNGYAAGTYIFNPNDFITTSSSVTTEMIQAIANGLDPRYANTEGDTIQGDITLNSLVVVNGINFSNEIPYAIQTQAFTTAHKDSIALSTSKTKNLSIDSSGNTVLSKPLVFSDGTIQTTAPNNSANNTKLTDISYDGGLLKTTIGNTCHINNLTCGNINTSHLLNTTSNLQSQINAISATTTDVKLTNVTYTPLTNMTSITGNTNIDNLKCATNVVTNDVLIEDISVKYCLPPVGSIMLFAAISTKLNALSGYLPCHGQLVSKTTYSALWDVIGDTYLYGQTASATSFYLPDLRGMFVRGSGTNGILDNPYNGVSISGLSNGVFQGQSVQSHTHQYEKPNTNNSVVDDVNLSGGLGGPSLSVNKTNVYNNNTTTFTTVNATTFTETRPNNISMNYIIKF